MDNLILVENLEKVKYYEVMTKRTRSILFLICAVLFLLTAPSAVLYSQGWRLDTEQWKVVKVGGLHFKVQPKRATISVNGKNYKTDYIFGSRLIEGLIPKTYQVKIKKKGFLPWEKELKVKSESTTKAENVVLIPKKIEKFPAPKSLKDLKEISPSEKIKPEWEKIFGDKIQDGIVRLSPDSEKLIQVKNHEIWLYFLEDLEAQPSHSKGEKVLLARFSEKIKQGFWFTPYHLIINVGSELRICEIDTRDKVQVWKLNGIKADQIFFDSKQNKLYFTWQEELFTTEDL